MFRLLLFFFFKQKTAYEMRISDWSSDVCSSDLRRDGQRDQREQNGGIAGAIGADPPEQGQVGAERDHRAAERQIDKRDDVRHRGVEGQRRTPTGADQNRRKVARHFLRRLYEAAEILEVTIGAQAIVISLIEAGIQARKST